MSCFIYMQNMHTRTLDIKKVFFLQLYSLLQLAIVHKIATKHWWSKTAKISIKHSANLNNSLSDFDFSLRTWLLLLLFIFLLCLNSGHTVWGTGVGSSCVVSARRWCRQIRLLLSIPVQILLRLTVVIILRNRKTISREYVNDTYVYM